MAGRDYSVIIAGAGPVGLALAVELIRQGVAVLVLEQELELCRESRAPGILPSTLELLRRWGLLERARREGFLLDKVRVVNARDERAAFELDIAEALSSETATPHLLVLPQNKLVRMLADLVRPSPHASLRMGHCITAAKQLGPRVVVQVSPQDGPDYEVSAPFLVACDGARSAIRCGLGYELEGKTYPSRLALADVCLGEGEGEDLAWPRIYRDEHGSVTVAIRMDRRVWRLITTLKGQDEEKLEPWAHESLLGQRVESILHSQSRDFLWSNTFRIHCRTSRRFRSGHILLAGDAAHINSPAGGQGMNSGIQDAHNLAWKLVRCLHGGDTERLLDSYEKERRQAVIHQVDRYTDFLTRYVLQASPWTIRFGGGFVRTMLRVPALRRTMARRAALLDMRYRNSPCLAGRHWLVGSLAPDGNLQRSDGTSVRLRDLVNPKSALVVFSDALMPRGLEFAVAASRGVATYQVRHAFASVTGSPTGNVLTDTDGAIWRAWKAKEGMTALIRPDGVVGWIAAQPNARDIAGAIDLVLGRPITGSGSDGSSAKGRSKSPTVAVMPSPYR